jgi:hypothetical protein
MTNAFIYRMPAGIAGDVQRREHATIETGIFDTSYPCLAYGILVKLVSGKVRPIVSADVIATVQQGFLARPFPIQEPQGSSAASELIGGGAPNTTLAANIMKRGYMSVLVTANGSVALADIAKGSAVYVRKTAGAGAGAGGTGAVGDIEAGTITGNELVTNAFFMGAADANGFCEIAFNI